MTISLAGKPDLGKRNNKGRHPIFLAIGIASIVCLVATMLLVVGWALTHVPSLPGQSSGLRIYDRHDKLLCLMFEDRDLYPIPLQQISKNVQMAIITSEDRSFYSHHGIDVTGVTRAIFTDIKARKMLQGGSTLTQQLIKNLYFSTEKRTMTAKLQEVVLAIELDMRYPKEQILETYLNYVYFGKGCYGIERASEKYFGKTAAKLTLAEAAYLAGLVNAPSELSTKEHHDDAVERQQQILSDMAKLDYVTEAAADAAKHQKLVFKEIQSEREGAAYYLEIVVKSLQGKFSSADLWNKGWKVYTNVDPVAQSLAQKVLTQGIYRAPSGVSQGALVSESVKDGAVLAIVGGAGSFDKSPWNRALSPHTAGSSFKPFVYLTALRTGAIQPNSILEDTPISLAIPGTNEIYSPKNFDGQFMGPLSVRMALALSRNVCAIKVAQMVGIQPIIETARAAGIDSSKLEPTLALALGASAVTPLEMAASYATFARGGTYIQPIFIRKMRNADGKVLLQDSTGVKKVFEPEPVAQLVDIMQDVVNRGTGRAAKLPGRAVAGKTGTADGARDVWFVGFTPDTVTAVWAGNDGDKPIAGKAVTGGSITAGIWRNYMSSFYATHQIASSNFPPPQSSLGQDPQSIPNESQQVPLQPMDQMPGQPQTDYEAMPPLAPDFRKNRASGWESDKVSKSKKNKLKKPGGFGKFLHKILGAFD